MELSDKEALLKQAISGHGALLIAYSGGVDSGLLAFLAHVLLGEKSHCVLLDSPVVSREEIRLAKKFAVDLEISLEIVTVPFLESESFRKNRQDRCYHCKKISSKILRRLAEERGLPGVADGLNVSDTGEYRPGIRAGEEEGIIHPFIEAGITKEDIRAIARKHRLPFWDQPSSACLASRIPYGEEITERKLAMIEKAEVYLHHLGIRQLRVRFHSDIARIEADEEGMATVFAHKNEVVSAFRTIGFAYITLDLAGYRSGSMDEIIRR